MDPTNHSLVRPCRVCKMQTTLKGEAAIRRGLCSSCNITAENVVRLDPEAVGRLLSLTGFRLNVDVNIIRADAPQTAVPIPNDERTA